MLKSLYKFLIDQLNHKSFKTPHLSAQTCFAASNCNIRVFAQKQNGEKSVRQSGFIS